jgi:hypothetical protein
MLYGDLKKCSWTAWTIKINDETIDRKSLLLDNLKVYDEVTFVIRGSYICGTAEGAEFMCKHVLWLVNCASNYICIKIYKHVSSPGTSGFFYYCVGGFSC